MPEINKDKIYESMAQIINGPTGLSTDQKVLAVTLLDRIIEQGEAFCLVSIIPAWGKSSQLDYMLTFECNKRSPRVIISWWPFMFHPELRLNMAHFVFQNGALDYNIDTKGEALDQWLAERFKAVRKLAVGEDGLLTEAVPFNG